MSSPSSRASNKVYLVIPAGGRGERMGPGVPKQFRDFRGKPLLRATIEAFFQPGMPVLSGLALAVPSDRVPEARSWSFGIPAWIVEGGTSRQESVGAALSCLPEEPDSIVLIHDAVRPFPPAGPIAEAIQALDSFDGVLLGEPSTDTLKRVDEQGLVLGTLPRETIFRAQTPQLARLGTWRKAWAWARESGFQATDDAALLEALGLRVRLVPSPSSNLKITTPEDWARATGCG